MQQSPRYILKINNIQCEFDALKGNDDYVPISFKSNEGKELFHSLGEDLDTALLLSEKVIHFIF